MSDAPEPVGLITHKEIARAVLVDEVVGMGRVDTRAPWMRRMMIRAAPDAGLGLAIEGGQ